MKINKYLLALLIGFVMVSCSDDSCDHTNKTGENTIDKWIEGLWYVEADNEEVYYGNSGTYYDRYSNVESSAETEGRYAMDYANLKLTYWYTYLGNSVQDDWTVKDCKEFSFKLSSNTASSLLVEKIVEQYKLNVGETITLSFDTDRADITVNSYTSTNELIASVSDNGTVTAMGGKGTTYIKMNTNVGNVWAKITVGDDNKDLWCDYVSIIGADYNTMRTFFARLGEPLSDGINYFQYNLSVHPYVDYIHVLVDTDKNVVQAIQLYLNDGVPPVEIKSYIKSRYYEHKEYGFLSTQPEIETSKAIVTYDENKHCVTLFETQHVLYPDLWPNFTKLFGSDQSTVKKTMENYGYLYYMSDFSYSADGSDYYIINDNKYLYLAGFVFNPDKQVSEFWLYLNSSSIQNEVFRNLNYNYTIDLDESTADIMVFYNEDRSLRVVLNGKEQTVVYTKLTMKQHEVDNQILGDFHKGIGLTRDQLVEKFGMPFMEEEDYLYYIVDTEYISMTMFGLDPETNICTNILLSLKEDATISTIVDYLNSKYTVFANGTASDGSSYAWTDGPSITESSLGITLNPTQKYVTYISLQSAANVKPINIGTYTIETGKGIFW